MNLGGQQSIAGGSKCRTEAASKRRQLWRFGARTFLGREGKTGIRKLSGGQSDREVQHKETKTKLFRRRDWKRERAQKGRKGGSIFSSLEPGGPRSKCKDGVERLPGRSTFARRLYCMGGERRTRKFKVGGILQSLG